MRHTALLLFILAAPFTYVAHAQRVMVMDIKDEIDPRMTRYVTLALEHATATKADVVLIEMNTYGGVLTDAKDIVDKIMAFKKPVWVFINTNAASAGALISIACDSIYMAPGASIGAATVVDGNGEKAPDKYQSYMRSIMRATAEEHRRDPKIAEGMVDEAIVIEGIKKEGQIITFSTTEAIAHGYCERKVTSVDDILRYNKIKNPTIDHFTLTNTDRIINFFINPFISGLLILIIIGGIYFELQTPGVGFPILASLVALVLYLVPYYLNGLADNWEIIMLVAGITLLAIEFFVIPGFGVAGIAGIALTLGALVLIMLNNDALNFDFVAMRSILVAGFVSIAGLVGSMLVLVFASDKIASSRAFRHIALDDTQQSSSGYTANFHPNITIGQTGMAHTVLRPGGKVLIDDKLYDAYSTGGYVEKGVTVEIVDTVGPTLRVKPVA